MKLYSAIVVGCGNIGALFESDPKRPKPATHAGAFVTNKRTRLVGLVDTNTKTLSAASKIFPGVPTFDRVETCLRTVQPDIVSIATPPSTHTDVIRKALTYGVKALVCEKPLACSKKKAKEIAQLFSNRNTVFVLNYQRRFFSQFNAVRVALQKNALGRIEQVTAYYSNGIRTNGSHCIDALRFLLGEQVIEVSARLNKAIATQADDQTIDALMVTKNGITVVLQGVDQAHWGINELRIYGEKGEVSISDYGYTVTWIPLRQSPFGGVKQLASSNKRTHTKQESMVAGALNHVVYCLDNNKKSESGVSEGMYVESVLDAIEKSAKSGKKVSVVQ